jgi:hypothetical protein
MEGRARAGCGANLSYSYPVNSANSLWLQDDARCNVALKLSVIECRALSQGDGTLARGGWINVIKKANAASNGIAEYNSNRVRELSSLNQMYAEDGT